jgi:hypothetical protein
LNPHPEIPIRARGGIIIRAGSAPADPVRAGRAAFPERQDRRDGVEAR